MHCEGCSVAPSFLAACLEVSAVCLCPRHAQNQREAQLASYFKLCESVGGRCGVICIWREAQLFLRLGTFASSQQVIVNIMV